MHLKRREASHYFQPLFSAFIFSFYFQPLFSAVIFSFFFNRKSIIILETRKSRLNRRKLKLFNILEKECLKTKYYKILEERNISMKHCDRKGNSTIRERRKKQGEGEVY